MQLCPQYANIEMLWYSVSIRGRGHQLDSTKKRLSSNQCTLCHDLIFHPIWSHAHWSLVVLWRIVSSGRFIGLLARNLALRRLLAVRLPLRQLVNGCCLASLGVVFRGFHVIWRSFTLPVWFTRCFNRTMTYIESFSSLSVWHTTNFHSSRLPSLCIWQFSTFHVEIKLRKFKVLPVLHVQIPIWKSRQTWVL